ncbi:MAG TPA: lysylphosphatidylglycerol synthase transmembrane domain-containing protein [Anaerolineaceae bacterium]|nr:lysylphosphatidylglycerol synthase transmembrane domain-containing protein [Anaerolineaceae bacterium]
MRASAPAPQTPGGSIYRKMLPGLALGFVVLVALVLVGDLRQVGQQLVGFEWKLFPLALLCTLFNYTLRFIKWHFYLGEIGVRNFPWPESLRLFVAGFPLAITPGKVGEVLKAVWLRDKTGVPVPKGVSVVVAERISDGLAVLGLSTFGVIAYPQYWPAFLVVLILLIGLIVVSQIRPLALWLLGIWARLPLIGRFAPVLTEFYEGSFALFRPRTTLLAVGLGAISWLGEGIGFYILLLGLGLPPSGELLSIAIFVLSFSTIVGAVTALPGGLGAAEVSIAGMLALLGGLSAPLASAATLLIRLATLWFGLALGLAVWAFSGRLLFGLKREQDATLEG